MNPRPALSLVRGVIATAAVAVHDAYEANPLAVHKLADKLIDSHFERVETIAMTDPVYAEMQERRKPEPGTDLWALGARSFLSGAEEKIHQSIRDRLAPDPLWLPLVRRLSDRPVRNLTRGGKYAYQRATRGWADDDAWDLGTRLCITLSAQLTHLADNAWGWPGGEDEAGGAHGTQLAAPGERNDSPESEDWTAALRQAAMGLEGWATHRISPAAQAALAAVNEPDDVIGIAVDLHAIDDAARLAAAQEALRWVADNLSDLWD